MTARAAPVRIATRKSPLAIWQARHVAGLLERHHPGLKVELLELSTEGDRFLAAPLSQIGGKGLFVKEIEQALIDRRADLAVHSLKDMTSELPAGLELAALPEREDPRDAFVGRTAKAISALAAGAVVGTSSLRRTCQLLARRPELKVESIRGNVQTRLLRMEERGLGGALLACAGLKRLGLEERITEVVSIEDSLPAVGQGVLALQCRSSDAEVKGFLAPLDHLRTRQAVVAERAFLAQLEGGCSVPLAGHAVIEGDEVHLRGLVGRPDGTRVVRGERRGRISEAERLGVELARELLERGGREILDAHRPAVRS